MNLADAFKQLLLAIVQFILSYIRHMSFGFIMIIPFIILFIFSIDAKFSPFFWVFGGFLDVFSFICNLIHYNYTINTTSIIVIVSVFSYFSGLFLNSLKFIIIYIFRINRIKLESNFLRISMIFIGSVYALCFIWYLFSVKSLSDALELFFFSLFFCFFNLVAAYIYFKVIEYFNFSNKTENIELKN